MFDGSTFRLVVVVWCTGSKGDVIFSSASATLLGGEGETGSKWDDDLGGILIQGGYFRESEVVEGASGDFALDLPIAIGGCKGFVARPGLPDPLDGGSDKKGAG